MDIQKIKDKVSAIESMLSEVKGLLGSETEVKLTKDEYLDKPDEEREEYDRNQLEKEEK